jgi:hypothetical protein
LCDSSEDKRGRLELFCCPPRRNVIPHQDNSGLALHGASQRVSLRRSPNASLQGDESSRGRDPHRSVAKPLVGADRLDDPIVYFRVVLVGAAALAGAGKAARRSALGARVGLGTHLLFIENGGPDSGASLVARSCPREGIEQIRLRRLRSDVPGKAKHRDGGFRTDIHRYDRVIDPGNGSRSFCYNPAIIK